MAGDFNDFLGENHRTMDAPTSKDTVVDTTKTSLIYANVLQINMSPSGISPQVFNSLLSTVITQFI